MASVLQPPKPTTGPTPALPTRRAWRLPAPWHSAWLGLVCLGALLLLALPLFVAMPLWCDVTLYDVAAWNVLHGGTHYRDVFDTNMPGVVWTHVAVRSLLGWSSEAMRLFDAGMLTAITWLLIRWLGELGISRAGRVWFAVGMVLFCSALPEICHCQRDGWMLLPVLLAVGLRRRRVSPHRGEPGASATGVVSPVADAPGSPYLLRAALEGCLWGLAIWIKPHVLVVALVVWLVSAVWIAGPGSGSFGRLLADTAGLVLGGAAVGALGIAWMLASGTWSPFWDVFLHWNPHYWAEMKAELPYRYSLTFFYLPPWSLLHLVAVPLALWNLRAARFWSAESNADSLCRSRALLAGLYLGWMAQTLYLQRAYEYVHVPETILALALLTAQRWLVGFACLAWFAGAALIWGFGFAWPWFGDRLASFHKESPRLADNLLPLHPLVWPGRLACWPHCLGGSSADLRDRLAFKGGTHPAASWSELEEVADYLRRQGLTDGELVCWHDTTHPLYLMLQTRPAFRFMHVGTALGMRERYDTIRQELLDAGSKRFVVSDLVRVLWSAEMAAGIGPAGPLDLPANLSQKQRHVFPFDQPTVFRSSKGRYLVHVINRPIGRIDIPAPFTDD